MDIWVSKRLVFGKALSYKSPKDSQQFVDTTSGKVNISPTLFSLKRTISASFKNDGFIDKKTLKTYFNLWCLWLEIDWSKFPLQAKHIILVSPSKELLIKFQPSAPEAIFYDSSGNKLGEYYAYKSENIQEQIEKYLTLHLH